MTAPSVTISVLAFHSTATIGRCLRSCFDLDYDGPVEIIVREQGGDDDERLLLERLSAEAPPERPTVVSSGPNLGFSAGHNLAIRASTAELVLVLNADAALDRGYLRAAVVPFADARVAAVQGKILLNDEPGSAIDTVGLLPLRNRSVKTRGHGSADDDRFQRAGEIFGPDGAVALFRRTALEDVAVPFDVFDRDGRAGCEYFDESFFAYKEDVDLAWRLQWRAWRTAYEPTAKAWHSRGVRTTAAAGPARALGDRMRMSPAARALGFANQRLMQIKNEDARQLGRSIGSWIPRELAAWVIGLLIDPRLVRGVARFLRLAPAASRKRAYVLGRRSDGADPYRWFLRSPDG